MIPLSYTSSVDHSRLRDTPVTHADISRAGEELSETVERAGHYAVGGVECLLDTVAVVNINIDVKNTRVDAKQLKYAKNTDVSSAHSVPTYMSFT